MARNIEIKARATDFAGQSQIAKDLADRDVIHLTQEDTFFNVPTGRLKLREFGDNTGELIQYERPDTLEPSESRYILYHTKDPLKLKEALTIALGIRAVVRKERTVYLIGQTRIHLDKVEGLGDFIELEVVLRDGENSAHGTAIAEELMAKLGIEEADLVRKAYVDLLDNKLTT